MFVAANLTASLIAPSTAANPVTPWVPLAQALIALINLCVVVYVFKTTRRDKRTEQQLAVDSFWLQKVIVEPHAKEVDELSKALHADITKAHAAARQLHEGGGGGKDEQIGSYAAAASVRLERFRFQVLPLLRIVVDRNLPHSTVRPSDTVDRVIDKIDDGITEGIARLFDDPQATTDSLLNAVRDGRFELLKVLFLLHRHPFEHSRSG